MCIFKNRGRRIKELYNEIDKISIEKDRKIKELYNEIYKISSEKDRKIEDLYRELDDVTSQKNKEISSLNKKVDVLIKEQDPYISDLINKYNDVSKGKREIEKEHYSLKKKYRALELEYNLEYKDRNSNNTYNVMAYACDNIDKVNEIILEENFKLKERILHIERSINEITTKHAIGEDNDTLYRINQLQSEKIELEAKYNKLAKSNKKLIENHHSLLKKYRKAIKNMSKTKGRESLTQALEYFANIGIYGRTNPENEWKVYYLDELIKLLVVEEDKTNANEEVKFAPRSIIMLQQMQTKFLKNQVSELKKLVIQINNIKNDSEAIKQAYMKYKGSFDTIEYARYLIRKKVLEMEMDMITNDIKDKIGIDQFYRLEDEIGYGEWVKREIPKQKYTPFDVSNYIDEHYSSDDYEIKYPRPTEEWH